MIEIIVDAIVFFILCIVAMTWMFYAKKLFPTSIPIGWFILSIGLYVFAMTKLLSIFNLNDLKVFFEFIGITLVLAGNIMVLGSIYDESKFLERRKEEINLVLKDMSKKYMQKEIDEDTLKKTNAELEKELSEIDIRLKEKKQ